MFPQQHFKLIRAYFRSVQLVHVRRDPLGKVAHCYSILFVIIVYLRLMREIQTIDSINLSSH